MATYEKVDDTKVKISETISTEKVVDVSVVRTELSILQGRKDNLIADKVSLIANIDAKILEIDTEMAYQNSLLVEAGKVGVTGIAPEPPPEEIII